MVNSQRAMTNEYCVEAMAIFNVNNKQGAIYDYKEEIALYSDIFL